MSPGLLPRLLDLLFPPKCPFCRRLLDNSPVGFCPRCQSTLPWLEGAQAERAVEFCALCVAPLRYEGMVREAVHRYKFGGLSVYASCLGRLVGQCAADHLSGQFDAVTWVPLSKQRLRRRGYDQAGLLARYAAAELGMAATPLLRKVRDAGSQSSLSDESARRANVLGAFAVVGGQAVAGLRVLLIDDVVTTGATLAECAGVLKAAGAAEVVCAALARAK